MDPIRVSRDFLTISAFKAQLSQVLRDPRVTILAVFHARLPIPTDLTGL